MSSLLKLTKEELVAIILELRQRVVVLEAEVARLTEQVAKLLKNSSNSSKPPSSDIVKPPKPSPSFGRKKRRIGGQLGHPRHERPAFSPDQIDQTRDYELDRCPDCGGRLKRLAGEDRVIQQVEIVRQPVTVSEHRVKLIGKVSTALAGPYRELLDQLPSQPRLNVDETGHKNNGKGWWTWCFRAELFTLFKIESSRGSDVLLKVLGEEFDGVLGCDYFSAYRKYMKDFGITVQFCLAHLIREVKFLLTLPDRATQNYAQRLLNALRQLFRVIHRREEMTPERFQRALERAREVMLKVGRRAPARREAQNLAKRFRKHGVAYFQFITTPGVEPTNNLAEQAIRFVVIDRRITQGTRSEIGRQWNERIWTTIATLTQQGRSIFAYLRNAFHAYLHNQPIPALLPAGA